MTRTTFVFVALSLVAWLLPPQISWAQNIQVATSEELVQALAKASAKTTIQLAPGEYLLEESLALKSGVTLRGAGMDKTIVSHVDRWLPSTKSLPDPEVKLDGLDTSAYLIRLPPKSESITIAEMTLKGPNLHGAVFGFQPKQLRLSHLKIQDFLWSGVRTLAMRDSIIEHCVFVDAGGRWKRGGIPGEKGGISGGAMFLTWVSDCEIAHNRIQRTNNQKAAGHYGIKGRQGRRCRIHHNTIYTNFSIEFPFEGDQDMEIDHNILRGAVSIPKYGGGKVPASGRTFHIHHNYFTTSYAIEFVRNGVEIDHNLFDFSVEKDGGNLISGFGKADASGPAQFHNNLINNPGRGVLWINEPYHEFTFRNNHIVARTTQTPRKEGLIAFNAKSDFSKIQIVENIVECQGTPRPLLRTAESYAANVSNNRLINVSDAKRFPEPNDGPRPGLEEPLQFECGVNKELHIEGWNVSPKSP